MKAVKQILFLGLILFSNSILAQQESQFSNSANNPFYLNPAAGGLTDVVQIEATGRTQWQGYNGGPKTMMITGNSQIRVGKSSEKVLSEFNVKDKALFSQPKVTTGKLKHVVGGRMVNDAIGPFAKTSVYGSYAIHLPLVKDFNFGIGVGLGWSNFKVDQDRVVLYEEDDIAYSQFLGNTSTQNIADVNAGLVFYNENFFLGLSTSQFLNNKVQFDGISTGSTFSRHYFVVTKYKFEVSDMISVEPQVVGKLAPRTPSSFDIGARLMYNNSSWIGFHYRTSNAFVFQVGSTIVKNLYIGYGYEHTIGQIKTAGNGTHEIQLGIYIGRNRNIDKEIKDNAKPEVEDTKEVKTEEPTDNF